VSGRGSADILAAGFELIGHGIMSSEWQLLRGIAEWREYLTK
jgi:hypothetical protein